MKNIYKLFKCIADILISLVLLIIFMPVFLIISLVIKFTSKGPVFFRQKRVGKNKKLFIIHKFRTMFIDTPKDCPTHLLENPDKYITKIGKFLRKTSLDEFPQIWDIFRLKMSIIGPRPALYNQDDLIVERDKYGANSIRPGLTGWAQVNGRDAIEIPEKAKLDGEYVAKMSLWFDIKIFFKTIISVIKSDGIVEGKHLEQNELALEIAVSKNKNEENVLERNIDDIKISIIVPSYKRDKNIINRSINSLLTQTYKNIEIIIVDDNAKPEHIEFRKQLEELVRDFNDSKIIFIQNIENLGGSGARNAGIAIAKGQYTTFLDDDDRYLSNKIERQLNYMLSNNLDMCFTDLAIYNAKEELIDYREYNNIKSFNNKDLFKYHLTHQITGTPSFMIKTQILRDINGFDIVSMGQEYFLMSKIIKSNCKIGYMPISDIVAYRTISESISTSQSKITGEKNLFCYKKNYFNILNFYEKQYIKCRHHAVLSVAYKRNRLYFKSIIHLFLAFFSSPYYTINEAINLKKRQNKFKEHSNMSLFINLINKKENLIVVGLGYVGLPLAVEFSKKINVIGYDINTEKINKYKNYIDITNEVGDEALKVTNIFFTDEEKQIEKGKFIIIAVPTPVSVDKTPDLSPVISASEVVGRNLTKGSIVVYESTVYPGVTEDICIPILERESHLKCGIDFKIGYSPERINPGDKEHRVFNIKKIVSGMDQESLDEIANVYNIIVQVGVYKAESIKVAEAAKVVENSQRDINIAFMNELAMAFNKMGIDTNQVINAMNTKWNALGFKPGLVGGHCIGVDPYYFIYEAEKLGYHSQIIAAGRRVNDDMGKFIAEAIIKEMILANKIVKNSKIYILGITFKENCGDVRNSKVTDIINCLKEYGTDIKVCDYVANLEDCKKAYGIDLIDFIEIQDADCIILAVAHNKYKNLKVEDLNKLYKNNIKIIIDIKSILDKENFIKNNYIYWNL